MKKANGPEEIFFGLSPAFNHMPGLNYGATDSAHQVFFGRDGTDIVAVKPFAGERAEAKAEHESEMLKEIRSLGFLTLRPRRIEVDPSGTLAFLLTDYVPNLVSMSAVVQTRNSGVPAQLRRTAETLGQLHAAGVSHGDAQIKNFALIPNEASRIAVIDPEKGGTETTWHYKSDPFGHDLESLVQSLAHKGYGGRNTNMAAERVLTDVIDPYVLSAEAAGLPNAAQLGEQALTSHIAKHTELYHPQHVA